MGILKSARMEVQLEWQLMLDQIRQDLENVLVVSNKHLTVAYDAAWVCEPECPCRDIEVEYTYILTQINEKEKLIEEWRTAIVGLWEEIITIEGEWPDYAHYRVEYETAWAEWDISDTDYVVIM